MIATPAATLPGTHAPDLTLSERLITGVHDLWRHLLGLSPQAVALNIGITAAIAIVCWLAIWALNASLCYAVGHIPGHDGAAGRKAIQKALRITRAAIALIFVLVGIVMIGSIWGVDIFAWMSAGFASKLSHTLLTLFIVLVVTAVAFEASGLFIGYSLGRLKAQKGLDLRRGAQIDTLGPIIRRTLQAAILVVGAMTVLSQLGVQIAPLLAGAGVVGIAVGFGAQTLMKDFFTGFFLLLENQIRQGDVVDAGGKSGFVEEVTLRYIKLRDYDGNVHFIPNGVISTVTNMSRTFAFSVIDVRVAFRENVETVMTLMREVAHDLKADPDFNQKILDDLEMAGVDRWDDSAVIIKCRFKVLPLEQWTVRREYLKRLKHAFDDVGIEIPYPHLTISAGQMRGESSPAMDSMN